MIKMPVIKIIKNDKVVIYCFQLFHTESLSNSNQIMYYPVFNLFNIFLIYYLKKNHIQLEIYLL